MGSNVRAARELVYNQAYKRIDIRRVFVEMAGKELLCEPCSYCGMPMQVLDHVPPLCMAETIVELPPDQRPDLLLVPACNDCNGMLGSKALQSIRDRAAFIHDRFVARIKKIRYTVWTDEELAEMGPNMQREIRRHQKRTDILRTRIHWAALASDGVDPVVVLGIQDGSAA